MKTSIARILFLFHFPGFSMKRFGILLTALISLYTPVEATGMNRHIDQFAKDIKELNNAALRDDYDVIIRFTHPRLIELMGGREQFINTLRSIMDSFAAKGYTIRGTKLDSVSPIIRDDSKRYAVLHTTFEAQAPGGAIRAIGFSIAVSEDDGETWKYLNAGSKTREQIKLILPDLPANLKLPVPRKPEFVPN